ncbi:MFS general substrate transporter [Dissoconium aciculare CBS 342.82]|uniref:MFS general substrate transporter n=1 Tax=Dissoconium aciculare CBS 342.82 TaxID=1314786 RepID=A0A6J3M3P7_9PEZI|nr:MFS general substrate transporter [Dissoconium aciculare CBS 342.82]KAF1822651.1 MFS general substrate transporter [Dissoconium aciculare CBS 342.82]
MPLTVEFDADSATPPDGGYGWVCVASLFLVNFSTWGAVASFGVYLSYYLGTELFPDSSDLEYALVGGFNFACAMIAAPLVTRLTHRFGKFATMSIGIVLQTSGYVAAGFLNQIWQLMITQGILVGLGIGFIYVPSLPILSQWFEARRSLANGIASSGSGFGGALFAWATGAIIDAFGLQWALCATGLITFFLLVIATSLLRDRNKYIRPPQLAFDTSLLTRYDVQLLLAWSFVSMLGYITLLFSLSDFALSIGCSPQRATNIIGFLNIGTAIGRPVIGIASDKSDRIDVAGALTLACGLSCFAFWIPAQSYPLLVFYSLLAGATLGVFWMTIGPLCVEVAGLVHLQSLLSLSWTTIILPTTFSQTIALEIRRPNSARPYLFPQLFVGLSYVCAALIMMELRRVKRKER